PIYAREQRRALLARGGVGLEVHVLHHQVDGLAGEQRETFLRRRRRAGLDVVQREQRFQRGGDGGVVVDDEDGGHSRSEEHTSELQSRENLVCRLLLEK